MIIDFHDDLGESYLASLGQSTPPELLKEASWVEADELLDRDFALIIIDENGREMRKFACHDPASAGMSSWYLENISRHVLPEYAVKLAEFNLAKAAGAPIEPPTWSDDEAKNLIDERRLFVDLRDLPEVDDFLDWEASEKTAELEGRGKSPYDLLKHASANWDDYDPFERHATAQILLECEKTAAIIVPDRIFKYGGADLNPHFSYLMKRRQDYVNDDDLNAGYERLSKTASAMAPDDAVRILYTLDEQASLTPRYGSNIPDPVLCVYGQEKQAEWSWVNGGDMVNARQLVDYSNNAYIMENLTNIFVPELVSKFRQDPIGTFKAMPIEQQRILARLSTQGRYSNDGGA